jgi:peptidoglycan hydrolase-like protein with peptidoglycan-binding domain
MKTCLKQFLLQGSTTSILSKTLLLTALTTALSGAFLPHTAIASTPPDQQSPMLIATAYTDLTLPTLRRGDRSSSVAQLQQILSDDGFLHAAGVRLGNPSGAVVDGIFGPITESAVRDLQQRYNIPVTGQVNPRTWEAIDLFENPYRSPLPWKL